MVEHGIHQFHFVLGNIGFIGHFVIIQYDFIKIKASQMSVFANLSTVVTITAGALILNETITIYDILGSILIILGVIGTNYFGVKKEHSIKVNLEYNEGKM